MLATTLLLAFTASLASAQNATAPITSEPFTLRLTSADAEYDGQFLDACHSGAAIEQLCVAGTDGTPTEYNTFALNTTTASSTTGALVWVLETGDFNVSSGLSFSESLTSNVVNLAFSPAAGDSVVGFDEDDKMFLYSAYYDEADFVAGVYPDESNSVPLYNVSFLSFSFCFECFTTWY